MALIDAKLSSGDVTGAQIVADNMARGEGQDQELRRQAFVAAFTIADRSKDKDRQESLLADALSAGLLSPATAQWAYESVNAKHELVSVEAKLKLHQSRPTHTRGAAALLLAASQLFAEAELLRDTGRLGEARRAYERCIKMFETLGRPSHVAMAHNNLGILLRILHDDERAKQHFITALEMQRRLNDNKHLGNTLLNLAAVQAEEDAAAAVELLDQAIASYTSEGDKRGIAEALFEKAIVHDGKADTDSEELLQQSIEAATEARAWITIGRARARLGVVLARAGRAQQALECFFEGQRIIDTVGSGVGVVPESETLSLVASYINSLRSPAKEQAGVGSELYEQALSVLGEATAKSWLASAIHGHIKAGETRQAALLASIDNSAVDEVTLSRIGVGAEDAEAVEWLKQKEALNPRSQPAEYAQASHLLGLALKKIGQYQEAVRALTESLELYRSLGDEERAAAVIMDMGNTLIDANDFPGAHECFDNAITYYTSVASQAVQLASCYNNQGYLLAREGRVREAIASYHQAIEELGELDHDVRVLAYTNIGVLTAQEDTTSAVSAFQKVMELTRPPDDALSSETRQKWRMGAAMNIALLHAASDRRYALSSLETGVDLAVRRADWSTLRTSLQQIISLLDDPQEDYLPAVVKDCLSSALALSGERAATCSELVRCAAGIAAQDWESVVNLLKELREVDPLLTVRIADEILRMDPENFRAHIGRGLSLDKLQRFEESDQEYRWCSEREPGNPIPWNNMAANALARDDAATAVRYAEKAAELNPDYANPWQFMALAHVVLGDLTQARDALRQYLRLASASEQTLELRRLLMSLETRLAKSDEPNSLPSGKSGPTDHDE